jgi:hypothetical protein
MILCLFRCSQANDSLDLWGVTYKNAALWVIYAVLLVLAIIYLIGVFVKSMLTLQITLAFTELIIFVIWIIVGVVMVILVCC